VRKFDYDVIKSLIPKDDETTLKRLKNIKKIQATKKKNDEQQNNEDNSDGDENDEFRIKSKPKTIDEILAESEMPDSDDDDQLDGDKKRVQKRHKKKSATYIAEENNGESIVDFLDTSATKKVRSSLPNANLEKLGTKQKKKEEFEIAPDGRIIIRDSDDDDEEEETFKKPKRQLDDDSDGEKDQENFATMVSTAARKRKRTGSSIASTKTSQSAMKYQTGGTGEWVRLKSRPFDFFSLTCATARQLSQSRYSAVVNLTKY
jgi:ribosomal RNA-processing protein 12